VNFAFVISSLFSCGLAGPHTHCRNLECKFPFHSPTPTTARRDTSLASHAAKNKHPIQLDLLPRDAASGLRSRLSDQGAGSSALVLPVRGQYADCLVVAGKTVDAGLDENQAELAVLVLAVALKVLADGDGLYGYRSAHSIPLTQKREGGRGLYLTFLISIHRSSGISGASPSIKSLCQPNDQQRRNRRIVRSSFVFPSLSYRGGWVELRPSSQKDCRAIKSSTTTTITTGYFVSIPM
jgi:hypothetical protein